MREELRTMVRIGKRRWKPYQMKPRGATAVRSGVLLGSPRTLSGALRARAGGAAGPQEVVEWLQDFIGDGDAPDRDPRSSLAVVVRAARHEEAVKLGEAAITLHRGGVMLRVPDFDSVQPAPGPGGNQMITVQSSGMRKNGDAARVAHDPGCLFESDPGLRHVGGGMMSQKALERLVERLDVPRAEQGLRDVGSPERAAVGDRLDLLERDPDAEAFQAREDLSRAFPAAFAIALHRRGELGIVLVESVGEEVNVHRLFGNGKLHARDQTDAALLRSGTPGGKPVERVVIGKRKEFDAVRGDRPGHLPGREGPVRRARVHVEIDARHAQVRSSARATRCFNSFTLLATFRKSTFKR